MINAVRLTLRKRLHPRHRARILLMGGRSLSLEWMGQTLCTELLQLYAGGSRSLVVPQHPTG
jgi:hypothetical protein